MKDFWIKGLFSLGLALISCGLILTPNGRLWADDDNSSVPYNTCDVTGVPKCSATTGPSPTVCAGRTASTCAADCPGPPASSCTYVHTPALDQCECKYP